MIALVDSSVWVDYLREPAGGDASTGVVALIDAGHDLATTEPVGMELLAGARGEVQLRAVETLTHGLALLRIEQRLDFRSAAEMYRAVRRRGFTVRSLIDCLIAAVTLRHDAVLVHKDADFEAIAEVTPLRTISFR